jgi:chemotaxis protein histidine kinase CheA
VKAAATAALATASQRAPQAWSPPLGELHAAEAAQAVERFRRAAHSLKCNSHSFGGNRLGEAARALEHGGLTADSAGIDALHPALDAALSSLRALARA